MSLPPSTRRWHLNAYLLACRMAWQRTPKRRQLGEDVQAVNSQVPRCQAGAPAGGGRASGWVGRPAGRQMRGAGRVWRQRGHVAAHGDWKGSWLCERFCVIAVCREPPPPPVKPQEGHQGKQPHLHAQMMPRGSMPGVQHGHCPCKGATPRPAP